MKNKSRKIDERTGNVQTKDLESVHKLLKCEQILKLGIDTIFSGSKLKNSGGRVFFKNEHSYTLDLFLSQHHLLGALLFVELTREDRSLQFPLPLNPTESCR